ncbi:MAG: V-type ATPase subunit [Candidatus Altiarchaeota archaeon]
MNFYLSEHIQKASISLRRPQIFGYSNARIRAMRTELLDQKTLDEMIYAKTIPEVAVILERTVYKKSILESARGSWRGADLIEISIGAHFAETCQKLRRIVPDRSIVALDALLGKWNVHNVKTIILAKKLKRAPEKIRPLLVPAGTLTPKRLERLIAAESVEDMAHELRDKPYGKLIKDNIEYDEEGKLNANRLLEELDFHYYRQLLENIKPVTESRKKSLYAIKTEITTKNLMTILRAKAEEVSPENIRRLLIPGGRITRKRIDDFIYAKDIGEVVSLLKKIKLEDAYEAYEKDRSLSHFEVALEKELIKESTRAFQRTILSFGTAIGFLQLLDTEGDNIRKIVRAKEHDIPAEKVKEMLVII